MDKAASPVNLFGASKLVFDKLFVVANNVVGSNRVCFSVVCNGNVVVSHGFVLTLFFNLIKLGVKVIPITDKNMTRFWITLDQEINFEVDLFKRMHRGEIFAPKNSPV